MNKLNLISIALLFCSLISCNSTDGITENQRITLQFNNLIEGNIDASQLWKTAVSLEINISTDRPTEIFAYSSGLEETILYDKKIVSNSEIVLLTVPQGYGKKVLLIFNNGIRINTTTISLTGVPKQSVEVNIQSSTIANETKSRVALTSSLYGQDIIPNMGYTNMDVQKVLPILNNVQEGVNADSRNVDTNYELISNGPFVVSMLYGYTGCYDSRILGYYYHSPGTYSDLKFVDLTETHIFDYIGGKAKLQYQLDNVTDKWYDANYDYRDGFEPPYTTIMDRLGDDAYNIDAVISYYKDRITQIRGLTYKIDVPKGYRIGFYLKRANIESPTQRESIIKRGIPSNVLPDNFIETNFSAMAMNVDGKLRSFYYQNDGVTFLGMEDAGTNGDFDCNDVIFGVEKELESELPTLASPDVDAIIQSYSNLPWTIAFEDIGRSADFDFNDAVVRIIPNYDTQKADVYVCAAGSEQPIYLYYDGPNGDTQLCEVHEALGGGKYINTTSSIAIVQPKHVATVDWPTEYSIANDAKRFYCQIKRGTCKECKDIISLNDNSGEMPQAILVAGNWNWPKEGINIVSVYNSFPDWSKDATKMTFWNWYSYPQADTFVNQ